MPEECSIKTCLTGATQERAWGVFYEYNTMEQAWGVFHGNKNNNSIGQAKNAEIDPFFPQKVGHFVFFSKIKKKINLGIISICISQCLR